MAVNMKNKNKQRRSSSGGGASSSDGAETNPDDARLLETIRQDDSYFAKQLDLIPRRFLIPLTDEQKEEIHEKQLKARTGGGKNNKKRELEENGGDQPAAKRKRDFNHAISNAEAIEAAARKQEEEDKRIAQQYLKSETLAPVRKTGEDASIAELRARLQSKIEKERAKGGVPGARAERDKLLPPRPPRPEGARKKSDDSQEATTEDRSEESASVKSGDKSTGSNSEAQKKMKKEELEAKISYGVLKIDDDASKAKAVGDKPARSATSTRSIINVKKLIKEAEKSQARMEALKAQGKEDVVQQERWDTLEKKAAGEKVRDDPKLLKKALKRLEKKKAQSAQEWQERKKQQEEEKKERVDEKQKHVEDRKAKKIEKRGGVVQKKDEEKEKRRRPGFEGANAPWKKTGKEGPGHGADKKRGKPEGGKSPNGPKSPFSKKPKPSS